MLIARLSARTLIWQLSAPALGINTKGTGGGELVNSASGSDAYRGAPDLTAEFEVKLLRPEQRLGFGYAANEAAVLHKVSILGRCGGQPSGPPSGSMCRMA